MRGDSNSQPLHHPLFISTQEMQKKSVLKMEPKDRLEPPPASSPPSLHQDDADEDDENVKQLKECSVLYLSLQECLVNSNRNWKSCQVEVQTLKACHEKKNKSQTK